MLRRWGVEWLGFLRAATDDRRAVLVLGEIGRGRARCRSPPAIQIPLAMVMSRGGSNLFSTTCQEGDVSGATPFTSDDDDALKGKSVAWRLDGHPQEVTPNDIDPGSSIFRWTMKSGFRTQTLDVLITRCAYSSGDDDVRRAIQYSSAVSTFINSRLPSRSLLRSC